MSAAVVELSAAAIAERMLPPCGQPSSDAWHHASSNAWHLMPCRSCTIECSCRANRRSHCRAGMLPPCGRCVRDPARAPSTTGSFSWSRCYAVGAKVGRQLAVGQHDPHAHCILLHQRDELGIATRSRFPALRQLENHRLLGGQARQGRRSSRRGTWLWSGGR